MFVSFLILKTFLQLKYFNKSHVQLPLPYLLDVQTESWKNFWESDLKDLLTEVSPIRDYTRKEFELWFSDFKLDAPKYSTDIEAKLNNDSYEASLRVKVKLVNLKTKEIKEQSVVTNRGRRPSIILRRRWIDYVFPILA